MSILQKSVAMFGGRAPKVIGPTTHAVIDYVVAGTFLFAGVMFWRRNKRAAIGSLACGAATIVNSVFTDYPGGLVPEMSFQTHGRIDAGLAALTATIPSSMGFEEEREARFFESSAIAETIVTALTDFDAVPHQALRPNPEDAWESIA
ncbi:MAG TPA: hypothetical protein VMU24_10315 [Candidatus Acidoferrales bacterium]|nr:hypothetical protein [Candidatus Acidoferrales bacterium]